MSEVASFEKYYSELRHHQEEARKRAMAIVAGTVKKDVAVPHSKVSVMHSTTGTGKTFAYAVHAGVLLKHGLVDRVCIVVPRSNLVSQIASDFFHPTFCPFTARKADNTEPLIRDAETGRICYVTTYQAVVSDLAVHESEFRNGRWLLILDEVHHLGEEEEMHRAWSRAIEKLVQKAAWVFCGTGTLHRHDAIKIPFLEYKTVDGKHYPQAHIEYTRRKAVADRAIIPLAFRMWDGVAEWFEKKKGDGDGENKPRRRKKDISTAGTIKDNRAAVRMTTEALDYRNKVIHAGITTWLQRRNESGYASRMIIICAGQVMAREVRNHVQQTYHLSTVLAITEEGAEGRKALEGFRKGKGDVLITVGMAYEGLDVPDAKFMICLTTTRSLPWLEQAFGRLVRFDKKSCLVYEEQQGTIWVPNDPEMQEIIDAIRKEQEEGLEDQQKGEGVGGGGTKDKEPRIIPIACDTTKESLLTSGDIGEVSDDERAEMDALRAGFPDLFRNARDEAMVSYIRKQRARAASAPEAVYAEPPDLNVDLENKLRAEIEITCRRIDGNHFKAKFGSTSLRVKKKFNKSREQMGVAELRAVIEFLKKCEAALIQQDRAREGAMS